MLANETALHLKDITFTCSKIKIADSTQPRKHSVVTKPFFPNEKMGSGQVVSNHWMDMWTGLMDWIIGQ